MYHDDVAGGIRTKVLAELMHHMIGLHGKSAASHSPALPDPSGGSKHDPAKMSMHGGISDKTTHMHLGEKPVDDAQEEAVESHGLGDLFGRKKQSGSVEF